MLRFAWLLTLALLFEGGVARADEREHFFETRIRPVLVEKCFKCHGGEKVSSQLRVDSLESLVQGGDSGAAIVPGKPDESLLLRAITYTDENYRMPPDKRLPQPVIDDFRRWLQDGAMWPKSSPASADSPFEIQRHWAFRPIADPRPPEVNDTSWPRNAIDSFVLHGLEAAKLQPSREADRATLIRRLKIDLLGLPPSYGEVQQFVGDPRPDAYELLVERYLASPHYGERWGRHWLDIARYADTKGYVFQEERKYPFAYTYRDWVIRSLNQDLPYDQFVMRQIAADALAKEGSVEQSELAAMGFLTLGRRFLNNVHDIIDDRLDVSLRGTMALTIGCARCHDHKYDPIPQADYYSLYGVFAGSHEPKDQTNAMALAENDKPYEPVVFLRGQPGNRGPAVPRQFLEVIAGPDRQPFQKGSGRLELAQAITATDNPLTARVIVNRVWREHFHSVLVRSTSDFGLRCDPPTHPELLDYLASRLIESGWSLKSLHRQIVQAATYRQRAVDDPPKRAIDSENRLLWRMNRGRLNLEAMRDSILASTGGLDLTVGGPPVDILQTAGFQRRTIYGFVDRQNLPAFFRTFDFAVPDTHSPGRFETSVPQQALFLRNSAFLTAAALRVADEIPDGPLEDRLQKLVRRIYGRDPDRLELQLASDFVGAPTPPTHVVASNWSYGFGRFDSDAGKLVHFAPLPHFTGKSWQGGPNLPDPVTGWVMWTAEGGHPGDADHAAVLRWTAPRTMQVRVQGSLKHGSKEGNGVQAFVASPDGLQGRWTAKSGRTATGTEDFAVKAGEFLDFVVDAQGDVGFDSFQWAPRIEEVDNPAGRWSASEEFRGPQPPALDGWAMLAQVLLLSNEFQFVD